MNPDNQTETETEQESPAIKDSEEHQKDVVDTENTERYVIDGPKVIESGEEMDSLKEKSEIKEGGSKDSSGSEKADSSMVVDEEPKEKAAEVEIPSKSVDVVDHQESSSSSSESVLEKYSTSQLRTFMKHFMKVVNSNGSLTLSDISSDCQMSETELKEIAKEVSKKCDEAPVVSGKRQSFKIQTIFLNSMMVEKFSSFKPS